MYKIKNAGCMGSRTMKRKTNMSAQLARMTQLLIRSPSTWKTGTTTELHQGITSRMAERRCQVVEEVEAAKAVDKTDGEEDEVAVGKRRV
jgi:hypothetical protein